MPELPDVTVYVEAMRTRVVGHKLDRAVVRSPFLLRTADPRLLLFRVDRLNGVALGVLKDFGQKYALVAILACAAAWLVTWKLF